MQAGGGIEPFLELSLPRVHVRSQRESHGRSGKTGLPRRRGAAFALSAHLQRVSAASAAFGSVGLGSGATLAPRLADVTVVHECGGRVVREGTRSVDSQGVARDAAHGCPPRMDANLREGQAADGHGPGVIVFMICRLTIYHGQRTRRGDVRNSSHDYGSGAESICWRPFSSGVMD